MSVRALRSSGTALRTVIAQRAGVGGALIVGVALILAASYSTSRDGGHTAVAPDKRVGQRAFGDLPLSFVSNEGQTDPRVDYLARGPGYLLFLNGQEAVWSFKASVTSKTLKAPGSAAAARTGEKSFWAGTVASGAIETNASATAATLKLSFSGANTRAHPKPEAQLPGRSNYFIGKDPAQWVMGAPSYGRIRYEGIYPGVDVVYYGNQRQLEYDFVVAPGADAASIHLAFAGATTAHIDGSGDLVLDVGGRDVVQHKPVVYQGSGGRRTMVDSSYVLASRTGENTPIEVALKLGDYDHARDLVIDPVLVYSTYVSGSDLDDILGVALDADGNLYATGTTYSVDFPVVGGLSADEGGQPQAGSGDAFIAKLNPEGTALIYSTYLAGSDWDFGSALKVDDTGAVYLTGFTASTNFPVVGGLPPEQAGSPDGGHSPFVAKLNPAGDALMYSTYLGAGAGGDEAYALGIDDQGNAYVTGFTSPPYAFPIVGGLADDQGGLPAGDGSIFITKLNPAGNSLVYSTYLSGSDFGWATTLAVDDASQVYIGGLTYSLNMPRVGGLAPEQGGVASQHGSAYYAKLNAEGNALVYSTYLGGADAHTTYGDVLTIDADGSLYAAGRTSSAELPIVGGLPPEQGGGGRGDDCCADIYIAKFNPEGNALVYGTYFAGNWIDGAYDIAVDGAGNLYLTGQTNSTNFPQVSGLPSDQGGDGPVDKGGPIGPPPCAFAAELNPDGDALVFSTYLCANATALALALSNTGDVYIAGHTGTAGIFPFPIVGGLPPQQGGAPLGGGEAFIARLTQDAPLLSFARARYNVGEDGASIGIVVMRVGPPGEDVSVDFATTDGTAIAGLDYVAMSGTLTWSAGDMTPRTVTIAIIDDEISEGDEFFVVNLTNGSGATIGTPASATVHITGEPLPDLVFADGFDGPPA